MVIFKTAFPVIFFFVFYGTALGNLLVNLDFETDSVGQKPVIVDASFSPSSNQETNGARVIDSSSDPMNPLSGKSLYVYDLSGDLVDGEPTHLRFPFNGGTNRTEVRLSFDFQRAYASDPLDTDTRVHIALGRVGNSLNNSDFRPFELRIQNNGDLSLHSLADSATVASYLTDSSNHIDILTNSHDTNTVTYDLDELGAGSVLPNSLHLFLNKTKLGEFDYHVTPDPENAPQIIFNQQDDDLGQVAIYQDSKRQGGIVFDNILITPLNEIIGPPASPESLGLTSATPFSVELAWTDVSDDEIGFIVERRTGLDGGFDSIATVTSNVTSYLDASVSPETDYTYRIVADNGFKSDPSNDLHVTTPEQVQPVILNTASDRIVLIGSAASFSVTAVGRDPLLYQWYAGETGDISQAIEDADTDTYQSESLTVDSKFWVRVSNDEGVVDSQTFEVNVRKGTEYTVNSRSEIESALSTALPGDTLIISNGIYQDLVIAFEGNGLEKAPITLRAETPGKVILMGESRVQIGGQWLVLEGLVFTGSYSGNDDEVIQFRSSGTTAADCRVSNCSIIDYIPENGNKMMYVSLYGERNRVDHCYFSGHNVPGVTLVVWLEGFPNYHRIDHNHFANRIDGGENGWETIRIGTSDTSLQNSRTMVEHNLFTKTDGEIETISNKSCENVYRYNTFRHVRGTLTLRHGNRCLVDGNYFIGDFIDESGGVRVIGEDHVVINNYFESTTARDGAAVTLYPGVPGAALNEYFAAHNAVVAFNTFYNNSGPLIDVSARYGTSGRTILPTGLIMANNILVAGSKTSGDFVVGQNAGTQTWAGNIIAGRSMGADLTDGFVVADPILAIDPATGIRRISESSPAINAASSVFDDVQLDIDGQTRIGVPDVGADEFSGAPGLRNGPLFESEVGPGYAPSRRTINTSLKIPFAEIGWPSLLSETGAFKDLQTLEPEAGILHYEPKLSFWSDYAKKSRWFYIPVGSKIGYSENGNWQFPGGSVWIKHFEIELRRDDPSRKKRIETRFLVKTDFNVYGFSYRWNEEGTDAALVDEDGVSFELSLFDGENPISQTWSIPSRSDCRACHTVTSGSILSFTTRQLNHDVDIDGTSQNFLAHLSSHGFLDIELDNPEALPSLAHPDDPDASLDFKARSYLAVNCVSCHQPGGTESDSFDIRPHRSLEHTRLIDGVLSVNNGNESLRLVKRGEPDNSVLLLRMLAQGGFDRMPPIGSNEIDPVGTELIRRWISEGLSGYQTFSEWQLIHFGEDVDDIGDADDDPDKDGDTNGKEFLNQTNPWLGTDASTVQIIDQGGSRVLRFGHGEFADYRVETSRDLDNWELMNGIQGRALTKPEGSDFIDLILQSDEEAGRNQFYRVIAEER